MSDRSMYESDSGNGGMSMTGFLLGAVVGAGVALLLTPATGGDMRRKLGQTARRIGSRAGDLVGHGGEENAGGEGFRGSQGGESFRPGQGGGSFRAGGQGGEHSNVGQTGERSAGGQAGEPYRSGGRREPLSGGRSPQPGTPGTRQQMPRLLRSICTPACEAR